MAPRIVEVVGVAGAGKTTLCQSLYSASVSVHLGKFPDVRRISSAPFFIGNGLQLLPVLLDVSKHNSRKLTRREFAWLSILFGWPVVLKEELKDNKTIILDQGPLYLLADISEFGPEYLREYPAKKLWRDLSSRWIGVLDIIVWLDAPDADLLKRIRGRDKEHVVKNKSIETTFEFLARYRMAYERIISEFSANCPGLKILRFDTSLKTPQEITTQLLLEPGFF